MIFQREIGILIKIFAAALATLILLEISLATVLSLRDRRLFYSRPTPTASNLDNDNELVKAKLHPYFGFAFVPGLSVREIFPPQRIRRLYSSESEPPWIDTPVNALGFLSPYSYPLTRTDADEFLVAITGGSVAQWFALQGTETLGQILGEHDVLEDRPLVFLNLASAGYKQPQQLLIVAYLLSLRQDLDMVINIDGFNEVALSNMNQQQGIHLSMPSSAHLKPLASLGSVATRREILALIVSLEDARRGLKAAEGSLEHSRLAVSYFLAKLKQRHYAAAVSELSQEIGEAPTEEDSILHVMPTAEDGEADYHQIATLWLESSHLMASILKHRGIPYFHFVQPNQYYSTIGSSEGEQASAVSDRSRYRESVEKGYPLILDAAERLAERGTNVFSATTVFDGVSGPVYSDNCCHYNQRGNEILASFIAEKILSRMGRTDRLAAAGSIRRSLKLPTQ
jgi:hypothetical protein